MVQYACCQAQDMGFAHRQLEQKVEQVVMKALAKDPNQRFASVQAFANTLEHAHQSSKPISTTVSPPLDTPLLSYRGHVGGAKAVAWSPDGKRVASASFDGTVQMWDAVTGTTLLTYHGHTDNVYDVAWSPDGRYIASASKDHSVQVWSATTKNLLFSYSHTSSVTSVAWSPDGKRIASGGDDTVQVWDATTRRMWLTYRGHTRGVWVVAWSPDGKRIAFASYGVQVWQVV